MCDTKTNVYDLTLDALAKLLVAWGEKPFRAKQIYRQLYVQLAQSFTDMTDLSVTLRRKLEKSFFIGNLELVTVRQGDRGMTRKALFRLPQGETIETVLLVYSDRATVCVSSQAGCPMGCVFCATAKLGFLWDLTAGQIAEQVLWAAREARQIGRPTSHWGALDLAGAEMNVTTPANSGKAVHRLSNVVFMGMGEAFNNYDAWWESVERLHDPKGFNMGARNFTVSTVGLVPGIKRLAQEKLPINLAVSLHASDDVVRSNMMPVNNAYPIRILLQAVREYATKTRRRVSFEYVLLQGKNDSVEQAEHLAGVLRNGPLCDCLQLTHVNLIPWNPVPGTSLVRSSRDRVMAFQQVLTKRGIPCTVRVERGVDMDAACGQLAGVSPTG